MTTSDTKKKQSKPKRKRCRLYHLWISEHRAFRLVIWPDETISLSKVRFDSGEERTLARYYSRDAKPGGKDA